jgi:hypothetical protein
MDRVRKPNVSESYTPSSESYSNYEYLYQICSTVQKVTERETQRHTDSVEIA